jgi:glycosyltransferase involved in cell wall biosynthesis
VTDTPALAVVISCYNYAAYVGEAIASVLGQGRDDCELVVVDDGSTDGSWEVIAGFGVPAHRIANGGQAAACLYGLERTRAPFVLFLDADDALKPGALDVILRRLDPGVAKLQFGLTPVDAEGRLLADAEPRLEAFRERARLVRRVMRCGVYKTPPTSGNVFRRDVCELLREVDYDRAVDGVILFAAPLFGDVLSLPEALGLYRIHGGNDSGVGGALKAGALERDLARFAGRHRHLGEIVRRTTGQEIVDVREVFHFQERTLYLDIVSRRRPTAAQVARLFRATWREEGLSNRQKLAFTGFLAALSVLPNVRAASILRYRLRPGRRTVRGLLREMACGPAQPA